VPGGRNKTKSNIKIWAGFQPQHDITRCLLLFHSCKRIIGLPLPPCLKGTRAGLDWGSRRKWGLNESRRTHDDVQARKGCFVKEASYIMCIDSTVPPHA
jgi:hypothetical protein